MSARIGLSIGTREAARTLVATVALVASTTSLEAAIIVRDGFEYGAANINLSTTTSTMAGGTGLGGSWQLSSQNGNNHATYVAAGLTFTNLLTAGGAIRMEGQWSGSSLVSRQLSVTHTGTLYGSFLVKPGAQPYADANQSGSILGIGSNGETEYPTDISVSTKQWDHATPLCGMKIGRSVGGPHAADGSSMAYNNTTSYLLLIKATNVGGSGSKTAAFWCLTAAQFAYFRSKASDPLTEAELDAAALGTGSAQVLQRGSKTSSNTATFDTTRYLNLITSLNPVGPTVWYMTYDELRLSNASLNETVPLILVPDKGTAVIVR